MKNDEIIQSYAGIHENWYTMHLVPYFCSELKSTLLFNLISFLHCDYLEMRTLKINLNNKGIKKLFKQQKQ